MLYIGIDPGQKGGLCLIDEKKKPLKYSVMPNTVKGIVDWFVDVYEEYCEQKSLQVTIISEKAQPMPKQGVTSAFTYGQHYGIFETLAAAMCLPFIEVRPAAWKKSLGLNSEKTNSIKLCKQLFPSANLIPTPKSRKDHDGIAEALLIAEWGRMNNK
jgi:crossover junction endodeoxyribonuclease RuvC